MTRNSLPEAQRSTKTSTKLSRLYEIDETAWLEQMSQLVHERRYGQLDYKNLGEFLADMAKRDKREVSNRLRTLLVHLLKWEHQPRKRSRSWEGTILTQRYELQALLESRTLKNYMPRRSWRRCMQRRSSKRPRRPGWLRTSSPKYVLILSRTW
jgi:Domain of unknown function DUF29